MRLSDRAFVISLKEYPQNLQTTIAKLQANGFKNIQPHVVIRPSKREFREYHKTRKVPTWAEGGPIKSPGALGCLQSHKNLLQQIVKDRQPSFIFEDDILIHKNFKWLFANAASATNGCNWIYLGCSQKKWGMVKRTKPVYNARMSIATFAYWVSEEAAELLLSKIDSWFIPVDAYYASYWQVRCNAKVCFPYLMIHDVSNSSTGQGKRDIQRVKEIYGWKPENYM